ncbi:MAG: hypothetical protein MJ059_06200 [Lachnospiraceae bacterium]|nr:hypothetical protein [Lachnospiraceae bacterium]
MSRILIKITSSVNGGICVCWPDGKKVWVDLYPEEKARSFSALTDTQWDLIKCDPRFIPPVMILTTHNHPDHFSPDRTKEAGKLWPDAEIVMPEGKIYSMKYGIIDPDGVPGKRVSGSEAVIEKCGITARYIRTVHSGKKYVDTPHYSILLSYMDKSIFISGDAAVADDQLTELLGTIPCDIAVLNFPWAALRSAREVVVSTIRASHVLLTHIPNKEDNIDGYREMARTGAALLDIPDVRMMLYPFREETFNV